MIKEIKSEVRSRTKVLDIDFDINGTLIPVQVEIFFSDREGIDTNWRILSRPKPLTDEELDELDNFIRDNYII